MLLAYKKELKTMLILGSTSPRRKEILSFFKIPFHVLSPEFDELSIPYEGDPNKYVEKISLGKAEAVKKLGLGIPILTADTIVCFENEIFLKPENYIEAKKMLTFLCGKTHKVLTSVSL